MPIADFPLAEFGREPNRTISIGNRQLAIGNDSISLVFQHSVFVREQSAAGDGKERRPLPPFDRVERPVE
ncbi:hypothetical protein D3C83_192170 [compost metagenome]